MAHPAIAVHFLEDFVSLPVFVVNLAHLAGVARRDALKCVGYMLLSATAALGGTIFTSGHVGAVSIIVSIGAVSAASTHMNVWVNKASELSSCNMMRCMASSDLLKC